MDPYTEGAIDVRYHNLNRSFAFEGNERLSYEAGWRHAFKLACQRPDAAELLPHHFQKGQWQMMAPVKMDDLNAWLTRCKFPIGFDFEAAAKFWLPDLTCDGLHRYEHKGYLWDAVAVKRGHRTFSMASTEPLAWAKALYIIGERLIGKEV